MVDADKLGLTLRIASKDGIGSENGCPHGRWGALGTQLFDGTGFHITLVISLSKLVLSVCGSCFLGIMHV